MHSVAIGGAEVAILSAIPLLARRYDTTVVVLGSVDSKLLQKFTDEEKKVFKVFDYPIYKYPFIVGKLASFILSLSPDIVVASLWRSAMVSFFVKRLKRSIRLVTLVHSTNFPHYFARYFNGLAVKLSDLVLADSQSTFQFVQSTFKPKAILKKVSFIIQSTPAVSSRRSLPSGKPMKFLFLARITKVKNLPKAIEFVSMLVKRGHEVSFDVYGRKGDGYEKALAMVKKLGLEEVVSFKGEIDPLSKYQLFSKYHFLIQFSIYEGMAMSVAESMQFGLPCIVTAVGEIPNYAEDMKSAIFADANDSSHYLLLEKVEQVIRSKTLYEVISFNAQQQFMNVPTFADSLIDNIEELIKNNY